MPALPPRPDLDQLRRRARELLRAAQAGDATAITRLAAVSDRISLASAQLALAREHGFSSWPRLRIEVERRAILDSGDPERLAAFIAAAPALAVDDLRHWRDHPLGAAPLSYVAMLRYDTVTGTWRDVPGTSAMAAALLDAGAPVDGAPDIPETPLITAASYGDAEVARVLVAAGADLETVAAPDAGGVPGATALVHAAVFGMTSVVDVLVAAGAWIDGLVIAAAAGNVDGWPLADAPLEERVRAMVMAADHERLPVIDALVEAGTPVDAVDPIWGRQALRVAAENGRPSAARRLLALGADPELRDADGRSPLDLCRAAWPQHPGSAGHGEVMRLLEG